MIYTFKSKYKEEWYEYIFYCNDCFTAFMCEIDQPKFCPRCGAKFEALKEDKCITYYGEEVKE